MHSAKGISDDSIRSSGWAKLGFCVTSLTFPMLEVALHATYVRLQSASAEDAYDRLSRLPDAGDPPEFRLDVCSIGGRDWSGGQDIEIETAAGETLRADFLIVAVGFEIDFHRRRELAAFADLLAQWRDRLTIPAGEERSVVATYPYLGSTFEFLEKVPVLRPILAASETLPTGSMVSMGLSGAAISGLKYAVPRLVFGITRSLFVEDAAKRYDPSRATRSPELVGRFRSLHNRCPTAIRS